MAAERDKPVVARGLTMVYRSDLLMRRRRALDGLDLDVERGEIFGFLGANGAGKTTTIKLLVGLIDATAGEARVLGAPAGSVESRRHLGFLPESPYFYEYLTARESLDFYGSLSGMSREDRRRRGGEVLELVGLSRAADERIGAFSKGMRERLGLAQALVHEPELLILDEPMSGLDPVGRRDVREIILAQRERGRTVFFSSHILSDVEAVCDRVAIISSGRLVEAGPLHKLISRRTISIDVTLEGVSQEQLGEISGLARRVIAEGASLTVTVAEYDAAERIIERARSAGGRLMALVPRRESLEEYFLRTQSPSPGAARAPGAVGGAR